MTKVLVNGANGKMGQLICQILKKDNFEVFPREIGGTNPKDVALVIDFSSPQGAEESYKIAKKLNCAFLC